MSHINQITYKRVGSRSNTFSSNCFIFNFYALKLAGKFIVVSKPDLSFTRITVKVNQYIDASNHNIYLLIAIGMDTLEVFNRMQSV